MIRFKVCCIASVDEARAAIELGASALGLVSAMPSGPGVISEEAIAEIAALVPPGVARVLLTSAREVDAIVAQQRRTGCDVLQLCDHLEPAQHRALRAALPGVQLIQVVHVSSPAAFDEAQRAAPTVDALLLDTGSKTSAVKELGGTGRTHDWSISARIRQELGVPVFLAGGLRAANVAEAVRTVRPYAVDVCSGVREDGHLSRPRLEAFARALTSLA